MTSSVIPHQTVLTLQQAFKVALSITLLYWLALSLNWDLPKYGALAIALISLDTTGASLNKGILRIVGTTFGLAVGLLGLALFAQDSLLTLLYHTTYLVIVGYFMQSSRYPYAWFVAGFMPSLVWATTYGKIDNAFSYATFRYLETTAGVVIYTAVAAILWPRRAVDGLNRQGRDFWQQLHELLVLYRGELDDGKDVPDASSRRAKLIGTQSQMLVSLQAASTDTPSVAEQKTAWELFRVSSRAVVDSMELWHQCLADCRHLDLHHVIPELGSSLDKLDARIARIGHLWELRSGGELCTDTGEGDEALLEREPSRFEHDRIGDLSAFDRAALLSFVQQLRWVHAASRDLLRTMRVLNGLSDAKEFRSHSLPPDLYRPSWWDPDRLVTGSLPAICFVVAYVFWLYFNPPTGPSVPNMAATFGLLVVLTPMNAIVLIPLALVAMAGFVAPAYFWVMPRLSTGPELLSFIFAFTFSVSALVVGRLAVLKTIVLAFFAMMTGISNDQVYSFNGLVNGALMILLAVGIIAVVQTLVSPLKPQQVLLASVRRFFRGCARVTQGFSSDHSAGRRTRKRYLEAMVLPAPAKVQAAYQRLDDKLYPDNPPQLVQSLIDSMQSISNRMQALEVAHRQSTDRAERVPESFDVAMTGVRVYLHSVFERWATLRSGDSSKQGDTSPLRQLAIDLERQFQELDSNRDQDGLDDQLLLDLYTRVGSVRGLIEAMTDSQRVIDQINWRQWATPRF